MPQYAPLPPIELDPRNESELVAAAAQRVYEASGATLNDFSSGSPIMALLEGQAFAQAELLAFANSFPESVLVEWIGPFLGAQRRTGSGSTVEVEFTIEPRDQEFIVFEGFELATDPNLTGGESIAFVTSTNLRVPAGESTGKVTAVSLLRGSNTNVDAHTITSAVTSLSGVLGVTNLEPAKGGTDPELLAQVKERFFTLIRRRNPVSAEDWVDFFSDALGPGTGVNVLPRRSEKDFYRYDENFVDTAPAVSFFVINPDGTPLTSAQRKSLQNLIRFSLPTEFTGTVYSMEVDDADISLQLSYDPNKPYAQDLRNFTQTVRDSLFGILTPNAVFPVSYEPNISDIEGALATALPLTLGTETQYIDPDIGSLVAYYTPRNISGPSFGVVSPKTFRTGNTLQEGDLVVNRTGLVPLYYEVQNGFTPITGDKSYHANIDDLSFEIIKPLSPGEYSTGQVISVATETQATLHVVLASFTYTGKKTPQELVLDGTLSPAKSFSTWNAGLEIKAFNDAGEYNPQIVEFVREDLNTEVYEPRIPSYVPLALRPGYPVWVAKKDFTIASNLADLGTAQAQGYVGTDTVTVQLLIEDEVYTAGQILVTPSQEQFLSGTVLEDSCYISELKGVVQLYVKALQDFTFCNNTIGTYSGLVDQLVADGILQVIEVVSYLDCAGRPLFSDSPFRYKARFALGEYLRYRSRGGFNASELENCTVLADQCDVLTPSCKRLIEANLPLPRYFQALVDFTPNTDDPDKLVEDGFMIEVPASTFRYNYTLSYSTLPSFFSPQDITQLLIEQGFVDVATDLIFGQTVQIIGPAGENLGSYFWSSSGWQEETRGIPTYRDLFRFAPGDAALFRNGTVFRQYEATKHVTPLTDLEVYFDNGIFVRTDKAETVKYYDPTYRYEDIIIDQNDYSQKFYRAIRSFTPPDVVTSWAGQVVDTPRIEEVFGNLLKIVVASVGSERLLSRLGVQVSTNKLGSATITVTSKANTLASKTFVWESTATRSQPSQLSFYTGTAFPYKPVNYGDGTLAL